jgi:hypothetical protein
LLKRCLMRRCLFVALLILSFPLTTAAQSTPRFAVFGGYTYVNAKYDFGGPDLNLNGWDASLQIRANPSLGIVADLSQQYPSPNSGQGSQTLALFGPRVILPGDKQVTPYLHLLAGFVHGTEAEYACLIVGCPPPSPLAINAFALDVGGGLDVKLKGRLWLRAFQLDWLHGSLDSDHHNRFRVSTGIVIRFGKEARASSP